MCPYNQCLVGPISLMSVKNGGLCHIAMGNYEMYMMVKCGKNLCYEGKPFLSESGNLGLILNFDFFQPYEHLSYSLGAIYMSVLNLPRETRFKQENTILVGLIPGPQEPSHDINSFLKPLVDDLKVLEWCGAKHCVS